MRGIFNAPPALRPAFNRRASHHATNQESYQFARPVAFVTGERHAFL